MTKLHLIAKEKLTSFIYIISDLLLVALGNEESSYVHSDKGTTEVISMLNTSKNCTKLPPYPHKVSSASGLVVNSIPIISGGFGSRPLKIYSEIALIWISYILILVIAACCISVLV